MNPTYDVTGRVAFVTGASSDMGLATARAFAEAGAAVTLADVNDEALRAAERLLRAGRLLLVAHGGSSRRVGFRAVGRPAGWRRLPGRRASGAGR